MDLKCKNEGCGNVYRVKVRGRGYGFVGRFVIHWKCVVCGCWNFCVKDCIESVKGYGHTTTTTITSDEITSKRD